MKHILLLASIAFSTTMYAQNSTDSSIKVTYTNKLKLATQPAFYLNDKFIGSSPSGLNPNMIESITVRKGTVTIDGIQYNGQIFVKTKAAYAPKLITLNELKFKYTNLADKSAVFMIDGDIINADYDKYLVDENNIFQIIVDDINNPKEKIQLELVKVLTKTDENIKKSKEIRIRGNEMTAN
jgi:hypothetical protein